MKNGMERRRDKLKTKKITNFKKSDGEKDKRGEQLRGGYGWGGSKKTPLNIKPTKLINNTCDWTASFVVTFVMVKAATVKIDAFSPQQLQKVTFLGEET